MRFRFNSYLIWLYGGLVVVVLIVLASAFWMAAAPSQDTGYESFGSRCVVDTDCACTSTIPDACGKPGQSPGCVEGKCGFKTDIFIPQEQASTTTWQTYRNEGHGFEFMYPQAWRLQEDASSQDISISETAEVDFRGGIFIGFIEPRSKEVVFAEMQKEYEDEQEGDVFGAPELITIAGHSVIKRSYRSTHSPVGYDYIFPEQGLIMTLANVSDDDGGGQPGYSSKAFTTVIESFKFIGLSDTSTLQAYRNEQYGFEMQYPHDWQLHEVMPEVQKEKITIALTASTNSRLNISPQGSAIMPGDDPFATVKTSPERVSGYSAVRSDYRVIQSGELYLTTFVFTPPLLRLPDFYIEARPQGADIADEALFRRKIDTILSTFKFTQ